MNDQTDSQLLRAYAQSRSEPAFAELVRRYVDLVYSAALRMVRDPHLAEDVTQGVFVALASNTSKLTDRAVLSGWLHRTAQNIAAQTVRTIERRRAREQKAVDMNKLLSTGSDAAWEHIESHLDEALGELDEPDRDAVLLRYFERKSAREMAQILGTSEEAAQKRVGRAVERLRESFARRSVTVGASGLAIVLTANAVQAAPAGLTVTLTAAATLAGPAAGAVATAAATKVVAMTTLQKAVIGAAFAVAVGAGIYQAREAAQLRSNIEQLTTQQQQLTAERDLARSDAAARSNELEQLQQNNSDLLRLRAEVGALRGQTNAMARVREENQELRDALVDIAARKSETQSDTDPERQVGYAKLNDAKVLVLCLLLFANDNRDRLPEGLDSVTNYWTGSPKLSGTNHFELVAFGSLTEMTNVSTTIAVRERQPWTANGERFKAYGFVDGHAEVKREPPEGFDAWEKQHIIVRPQPGQ